MLTPLTFRLGVTASYLEIDWNDNNTSSLAATLLRSACRCAQCRNGVARPSPDLKLCEIRPYGPNVVQLVFSDGHDRGLFPFDYLAELADEEDEL